MLLYILIIIIGFFCSSTNSILLDELHWGVSKWNKCESKNCLEPGIKRRTILCYQSYELANTNICDRELVKDKPDDLGTCIPEHCVMARKDKVRLFHTPWSKCIAYSEHQLKTEMYYDYYRNQTNNTMKCGSDNIFVSYIKTRTTQCRFQYDNTQNFVILDAPICTKLFNISSTTQKEICHQRCVQKCTLGIWTKWQICKHCRNDQTKYKVRNYASLPSKQTEKIQGVCPNRLRLKHRQKKGKLQYQFKTGEWKQFSILYHKKRMRSKFSIHKRNVSCIYKEGKSCDELINIPTIQIQVSDRDCLHGGWKAWSKCAVKDGSSIGQQYQQREILLYPIGNGEACNDVRQERRCDVKTSMTPIINYKWHSGNWAPCVLDNKYQIPHDANCKILMSNRNVFCSTQNGSLLTPVREFFCSHVPKPSTQHLCKVQCKNKCFYTDWSTWSNCTDNVTQRSRENYNNQPLAVCPRIIQKKTCTKNQTLEDDYFWLGVWNDCVLDRMVPKNTTVVNEVLFGTQEKTNICVNNSIENMVNNSYCKSYVQEPIQVKSCFDSQKTCALTEWTKWYPDCSAICNPFNNNQQTQTQRRRYVISQGNKYGEECPDNLIETKLCPRCLDNHWVIEKWDVCTHNHIPMRGNNRNKNGLQNGYQIRNLYCSDGEKSIADSMCHELKPVEFRECHINWLVTCNLKPWSEWSECSEPCGKGQQERTRTFTSVNCKNGTTNFHQSRACNTQPCKYFRTEPSKWGACHHIGEPVHCSHMFSSLKVNLGVRYRNITCYDEYDKIVPNKYCEEYDEEVLETKRRCILPCIDDCRLSDWSEFTPCSVTCGIGLSMRSRKILGHASKGRLPCPSDNGRFVTEKTSCKVADCFDFQWKKDEWDECTVTGDEKCGTGRKTRIVQCVQLSSGKPAHYCDFDQKPRIERRCHVPCKTDCLVSDWTEWSTCDSFTNRSRDIIQKGPHCPVLYQRKKCQDKINASWKTSEWSSCFIEKGLCGYGVRTRLLKCVIDNNNNDENDDNDDDDVVHSKHCKTIVQPSTYEICDRSCDQKCQISDWTTWSSCERSCGIVTYRKRERKSNTHCDGGLLLKETLRCPVLPCYTISVEPWSTCEPLYKTSCGMGTRERKATCTRDDGNIVDLLHCDEYLTAKVIIKESCNIPCWNDCIITPWSNWTSCFGQCQHNTSNDTPMMFSGQQIRTRSIIQTPIRDGTACPNILEQRRKCMDPQCFRFSWKFIKGQYKCKRSDGKTVSTGCKILPFMYGCTCPLRNAICIQKQYCMCEHGYAPSTDIDGNLLVCSIVSRSLLEKSKDKGKGKPAISIPGIICIALAICVGYCLLFGFIVFLYKRRNKKKKLRDVPLEATALQSLNNNQNNKETPERSRNLFKLKRNSSSCSSGISSSGFSEQIQLSESESSQKNLINKEEDNDSAVDSML